MKRSLLSVLSVVALAGCSSSILPLNKTQRKAELDWYFAKFETNYAPLEYKQSKLVFNYEDLKKDCYAKSEAEQSNDDFRALLLECVSRFQDAHTTTYYYGNAMNRTSNVAYLGFKTEFAASKEGTAVSTYINVTELLPTSKAEDLGLQENDHITKINGQSAEDYLLNEIAKYRNLGEKEANLVYSAKMFAIRTSNNMRLPSAKTIDLEIERAGKKFNVSLPWIVKDLLQFTKEQTLAQKELEQKKLGADSASSKEQPATTETKEMTKLNGLANMLVVPLRRWVGPFVSEQELFSKIINSQNLSEVLNQSFRLQWLDPMLSFFDSKTETAKQEQRTLPGEEIFSLAGAVPTKILRDTTTKTLVAWIRIASFSIDNEYVKKFAENLAKLQTLGVHSYVIDLVDNGGGSLVHGMRIVQMLSPDKIQSPNMQVRINNNWLSSFMQEEQNGTTDASREVAKQMRQILEDDFAQNKKLSRPISITALDPTVPTSLSFAHIAKGDRIAVVVNGMCASMCDIFSATVKFNKLGSIVGSKTMGAGGNVTQHAFSPLQQMALQQTESLIVMPDGTFLENNGVEPDVTVDMILDRGSQFSEAMRKAFEVVTH